ncbi:hypothetical protein PybrP1_005050 [[Pythium] brassicae (nom. inval.)]|nr:hypothetical protein PybrP1_005050 [[Pythium] brassicae (nom. inval.)]
MDSRVAQLQHVIFLKDQMILELQTQLAAYEARFGPLSPSAVEEEPPLGGVNTAARPSAKEHEEARESKTSALEQQLPLQQSRRRSSEEKSSRGASGAAAQDSDAAEAAPLPPPRPASTSTASGVSGVSTTTGKNVVLDFVEDSPMFRRQLEGFEESLGGLRGLLKEVLARTKEYVAAGRRYGDEETALAEEIVHRKYARALFTTSCPELGSLSSLFNDVHDTVTQIQSSRVSMLLSIDALMSQAISAFSEQELREATDLRKEVGRLADEYEALLSKLLAKPRPSNGSTALAASDLTNILGGVTTTPGGSSGLIASAGASTSSVNVVSSPAFGNVSVTSTSVSSTDVYSNGSSNSSSAAGRSSGPPTKSLEREVAQARLKFELARFDLVRYLNRLDCQKKFLLVECFNAMLYAFLGHFHACLELVKSVEPALRQRQELLQLAKRDFEDDDRMWRAQREALAARLRLDAESSARSVELPVEVVSADTLSSRAAAAQGAVVKQGYLFLRNSLFPARSWKRRWFQIHSGKLYQNRGRHMDLALVCDLMLSRVREASGGASSAASALPFCFEVVDSSQNRFLLQAASEADVQDWVDAARRSTESMLEKQAHRMSVHPEQQRVVDEVVAANAACADCGQAPAEWVSINIGCLLCIECSGIHRGLGVHVSKVRSLALDSWEMPLLLLLRDHLGNAAVNAVWEHTVPPGWTKPGAAASRDDKAAWARAKYHLRGFVEFSDLRVDELSERLVRAAAAGSVRELMWCLAHGADVNARTAQRETALHAASSRGAALCYDYLVLNGASLALADVDSVEELLPPTPRTEQQQHAPQPQYF